MCRAIRQRGSVRMRYIHVFEQELDNQPENLCTIKWTYIYSPLRMLADVRKWPHLGTV